MFFFQLIFFAQTQVDGLRLARTWYNDIVRADEVSNCEFCLQLLLDCQASRDPDERWESVLGAFGPWRIRSTGWE